MFYTCILYHRYIISQLMEVTIMPSIPPGLQPQEGHSHGHGWQFGVTASAEVRTLHTDPQGPFKSGSVLEAWRHGKDIEKMNTRLISRWFMFVYARICLLHDYDGWYRTGITGTTTRNPMIAPSKRIRTVSHCVQVSCALGFRPLNESEGTWTVKCVGWNAWSAWRQDGPIGSCTPPKLRWVHFGNQRWWRIP